MMQPIKTYLGYARERIGWLGRVERVARVDVKYIFRCTKCGLYFWDKESALEHKNNDTTHHP